LYVLYGLAFVKALSLGMPRPKISVESARLRFLLAAYELFKKRVQDNPWQTLMDEAFPAWSAIIHPRESSPQRDHFPHYVGSETRARRTKEARQVLIEWAVRYSLIIADDPVPQPADWILDHAEEICRTCRGIPMAQPSWEEAYRRTIITSIEDVQRSQNPGPKVISRLPRAFTPGLSMHPPIPYLTVPMEYPDWDREIEAFAEYKRRVRKAVKAYFRLLNRPRISSPERSRNTQAIEAKDFIYFEWVILRRCCRWKLKEIRARYLPTHPDPSGADSVISQAVRRLDELLGLLPIAKIRST
jgi:hypothetical protein